MHGELGVPPFTAHAHLEAGALLRQRQRGQAFGLPHSRPVLRWGHRVTGEDAGRECWTSRIVYRLDADAVIIIEVFSKKTPARGVFEVGQRRLRAYDRAAPLDAGSRLQLLWPPDHAPRRDVPLPLATRYLPDERFSGTGCSQVCAHWWLGSPDTEPERYSTRTILEVTGSGSDPGGSRDGPRNAT
jgi:hypothetical protein